MQACKLLAVLPLLVLYCVFYIPLLHILHSFIAFWLMLNCKALVAGTTSFMYQCNASDNGALAAMGASGSACHRNGRGNTFTLVECRINHI